MVKIEIKTIIKHLPDAASISAKLLKTLDVQPIAKHRPYFATAYLPPQPDYHSTN